MQEKSPFEGGRGMFHPLQDINYLNKKGPLLMSTPAGAAPVLLIFLAYIQRLLVGVQLVWLHVYIHFVFRGRGL